ncbi:MAG: radical SAM protein, partial [Spirochaetes bacterium]|nr:radical SAM protein [Spirochaetota bacterium]
FSITDEVRPAYISTSRSCPFGCTFCYHPLGNKYRQRSLDNVFLEIDYLVEKYDINLLIILDELFSINKTRMYEFSERIKKYNVHWSPQLRVSDVDEEVLNVLKESGVFAISYGIESLSDKILKSMRKKTTKVQIENALKLTYDAKIGIIGGILFGDPEETEETIKESIDWWKNHPEYGLSLRMIETIPDSPIYKYAIANGLIKNKLKHIKDQFPIINLTKLSNKKFDQTRSFVELSTVSENYYENVRMIKSKIVSKNQLNQNIFEIVIECPSCNSFSKYENMRQTTFNPYFHIYCRNCHAHLRINTKMCYSANYTLYNKIVANISLAVSSYLIRHSVIRFISYNTTKKLVYGLLKKYIRS